MKRLNFNIKDRKILYGILAIVLVSVFTLTIAYAALNAVLTIQGSAQVSSADWDIYLNNPRVTSGSATTNVPVIKTNSSLEFSTTLNMPGDFYEFTVDVVNDGTIDAMIENVIKTPELTVEQAKYLKYEVMYQNGESITTKQLLSKGSSMPIKVRVEYRKDINAADLPSTDTLLNLKLILVYAQIDGNVNNVNNNGVAIAMANGNIDNIGTIVTIGNEQFYTIGVEGNNVKLLSKYNLYVGYINTSAFSRTPIENPTGIQDKTAIGSFSGFDSSNPSIGTTNFSSEPYWTTIVSEYPAYVYDDNADIYVYVENYKSYLGTHGILIDSARLVNFDDLRTLGCDLSENNCLTSPFSWVYATSYWIGSADGSYKGILGVGTAGKIGALPCSNISSYGVRPVILINKNLIGEKTMIEFSIDDITYKAEEGMTWADWVESDYNTIEYLIYNNEVYNKTLTGTLYDYNGVVNANSLIGIGVDYHLGLSNTMPEVD